MVVGFGGFIKASDAVSHSNLLDKVSSRHLDMYKTAGEGSGSNSKWGLSSWGPVKTVLHFRAPALVFYHLPGQRS